MTASQPGLSAGDTIDLGPDLPPAEYTCAERWRPERIRALALYCSDGRWGEAFDEFCQRHLLLPRYDRWAVPGGPAWLAARVGTDHRQAARGQLEFLVRAHELERIVLITHYGCAVYGHHLGQGPRECVPAQIEDVRLATAALHDWFPGLTVDAYLAMNTGPWLTFHGLDLRPGL